LTRRGWGFVCLLGFTSVGAGAQEFDWIFGSHDLRAALVPDPGDGLVPRLGPAQTPGFGWSGGTEVPLEFKRSGKPGRTGSDNDGSSLLHWFLRFNGHRA